MHRSLKARRRKPAAANSALSSFSKELLSCHIRTCVEEDIREGREEKVEELVKTLQQLLR